MLYRRCATIVRLMRAQEALVTIRASLASVRTHVQVTEPKSARSRRTIALPTVAMTALRAHRVRQLQAATRCRGDAGKITDSCSPAGSARRWSLETSHGSSRLPQSRGYQSSSSMTFGIHTPRWLLAQGAIRGRGHGDAGTPSGIPDAEHLQSRLAGAAADAAAKMNALLGRF